MRQTTQFSSPFSSSISQFGFRQSKPIYSTWWSITEKRWKNVCHSIRVRFWCNHTHILYSWRLPSTISDNGTNKKSQFPPSLRQCRWCSTENESWHLNTVNQFISMLSVASFDRLITGLVFARQVLSFSSPITLPMCVFFRCCRSIFRMVNIMCRLTCTEEARNSCGDRTK